MEYVSSTHRMHYGTYYCIKIECSRGDVAKVCDAIDSFAPNDGMNDNGGCEYEILRVSKSSNYWWAQYVFIIKSRSESKHMIALDAIDCLYNELRCKQVD